MTSSATRRRSRGTTYADAAEFCLQQHKYLEDGLAWATKAVNDPFAGISNFARSILSQLQALNGKTAEAAATFDRAVASSDATPPQVHQRARSR